MIGNKTASDKNQDTEPKKGQFAAPTISLPKGGGAIRGIGEKFAANPVTGTGSMSVPIATSPGRSGFGPQLSLSYDSGAGNGPFGFGWSLSLPVDHAQDRQGAAAVRRRRRVGRLRPLRREDLVPFSRRTAAGPRTTSARRAYDPSLSPAHRGTVRAHRAMDESSHRARSTGARSRRDNVTTLYGRDNNSRIFDPSDPDPTRRRASSAGSSARATTTRVTRSSTSTQPRTMPASTGHWPTSATAPARPIAT